MEPTKEQLREQVAIGLHYTELNWTKERKIAHLTDHLWGTVGMWLQIERRKGRIESVHMGVDEIDEHEGEIPV